MEQRQDGPRSWSPRLGYVGRIGHWFDFGAGRYSWYREYGESAPPRASRRRPHHGFPPDNPEPGTRGTRSTRIPRPTVPGGDFDALAPVLTALAVLDNRLPTPGVRLR